MMPVGGSVGVFVGSGVFVGVLVGAPRGVSVGVTAMVGVNVGTGVDVGPQTPLTKIGCEWETVEASSKVKVRVMFWLPLGTPPRMGDGVV
jgi:hypothetical protein